MSQKKNKFSLSSLLLAYPISAANKPIFPDAYTAVLTLELPYAGLNIPLTFRVDEGTKRQQIDYYQGLQSDFYSAGDKFKYVFENGIRKCMKNEGPHDKETSSAEEEGGMVHPLPTDLDQYTLTGQALVGGIQTDRYVLSLSHGTTGSMDDHLEFFYDPLLKKPVEWHMHSRNRVFGSHTDEYVVKYLSFLPETSGSFVLPLPDLCKDPQLDARNSGPLSFAAESVFGVGRKITGGVSGSFRMFAAQHGLSYGSEAEWKKREAIFHRRVQKIRDLNLKHKGKTTFKLNKFAATELHELNGVRMGRKAGLGARLDAPSAKLTRSKAISSSKAPTNFDWRSHAPGSVGPVRDQGICGSCWAFSLVSAVESATWLKHQETSITPLPEQFVIDCTWNDMLAACDGGLSNVGAREIVKKFGGIFPTAASYGQYLTVDGFCRAKPIQQTKEDLSNGVKLNSTYPVELGQGQFSLKVGAKVLEFIDVPSRDQEAVKAALLQQPLSVAFNVGEAALFYDSGILDVAECEKNRDEDLNHAINLVGYGTDQETGLDFWLLRNSWSTYWGDQGYFKVVRGERDCGVSTDAGYPVVEGLGKRGFADKTNFEKRENKNTNSFMGGSQGGDLLFV